MATKKRKPKGLSLTVKIFIIIAIILAAGFALGGSNTAQFFKASKFGPSPPPIIDCPTYPMQVSQTVTVQGTTHKVTLLNVGPSPSPGPVVVDVDGLQEIVLGTERVNGVKITVMSTTYSPNKLDRKASL